MNHILVILFLLDPPIYHTQYVHDNILDIILSNESIFSLNYIVHMLAEAVFHIYIRLK